MGSRADKDRGIARPPRLRAVIFDLDDTLVLSTVDFPKFKRLVVERLASWGEDVSLYSLNETIVVIVNRYEGRLRAQGAEEDLVGRRLSELDQIMDCVEMEHVDESAAIQGAPGLLRYLRAKGVKIGVLTRGCQAYATTALRRTGMLELVDAIECRNSETKPKPDPEAYVRLVKALGVKKDRTLFVGDHPIDAQCARNAGVPFLAVLTGDVPEEKLREAGSVEVFATASEMEKWFRARLDD
jgi:HAD superfamily hydrolase (TIGR01549 family)